MLIWSIPKALTLLPMAPSLSSRPPATLLRGSSSSRVRAMCSSIGPLIWTALRAMLTDPDFTSPRGISAENNSVPWLSKPYRIRPLVEPHSGDHSPAKNPCAHTDTAFSQRGSLTVAKHKTLSPRSSCFRRWNAAGRFRLIGSSNDPATQANTLLRVSRQYCRWVPSRKTRTIVLGSHLSFRYHQGGREQGWHELGDCLPVGSRHFPTRFPGALRHGSVSAVFCMLTRRRTGFSLSPPASTP